MSLRKCVQILYRPHTPSYSSFCLDKVGPATPPLLVTYIRKKMILLFIATPLGRRNSLKNRPILKIKKALKTKTQELSSATKHVFVAQTV